MLYSFINYFYFRVFFLLLEKRMISNQDNAHILLRFLLIKYKRELFFIFISFYLIFSFIYFKKNKYKKYRKANTLIAF